jgi:DNA-binding response OmpR family regulator
MRARQKILVVDDSDIALELARIRLEEAGFDVETLNSPFGFSAALWAQKPDLVLLDVSMPALQGDRLLQIAHRSQEGKRRCAFVLYSDRSEEELGMLARSCGADGYVRKTSDFKLVVETIRKLLAALR